MTAYRFALTAIVLAACLVGCGREEPQPPAAGSPSPAQMQQAAEEEITEANMEEQLDALEKEIEAPDPEMP